MPVSENKNPEAEIQNAGGLNDLANNLAGVGSFFGSGVSIGGSASQVSQSATMMGTLRWYMVSNNPTLLSQMYIEHGVIQTLVDQPVEDAFRAGFEIKTGQLSSEEIEDLENYVEEFGMIEKLMQAMKWARLYGGAGLLIVTNQDPARPFRIDSLRDFSNIDLKPVDMWELTEAVLPPQHQYTFYNPSEYYDYYGIRIHKSRVIRLEGKEAPSRLRMRLNGWGMSVLERVVSSVNEYLKSKSVAFELLDEAKIDVYKISSLNNSLMTKDGTTGVQNRIQSANAIKNYNNAIVMDTKDEYDQKSITFSGLADMMEQFRISLASDTKFPLTKLFGISSAGFNSGEDDIENYNSMVESEVRSKCKYKVIELLKIACQIKFGFVPDDLKIKFHSLRVLSAEQEEKVKDAQFNRTHKTWSTGGMSTEEFKDAVNKGDLLPVEIDPTLDAAMPIEPPEQKALPNKKANK